MDIELATIHDIADELANRGLQFIIAIQVVNNNQPFKVHLCVDGNKDKIDVANAIVPFFNNQQGEI